MVKIHQDCISEEFMPKPIVLGLLAALFLSAPISLDAADAPASQAASQPAVRLKPPAVGEKAPELSLLTIDGKPVVLAESLKKGPVVVIELRGWVGYQCPICNQQVNELITHSKDILAKASQVILVYPGPADGLKAHAEEFVSGKGTPEGFTFVMDPDMKFVSSWGLRWMKTAETAYPSTFVIDKEGVVQFAKVSSSHGDRASAADITKALNDLK
jgi:peroxiredoxin Q/BCP